MSETNDTTASPEMPLPSRAGLAKATGIAVVAATVLLVLVVLPAEYGIDPTGFGGAIGLTRLAGAATDETADGAAPNGPSDGARDDVALVDVPAGGGVEYKYFLRAGETMEYTWSVDEGSLYYDFHGEPEGDESGAFVSHSVSTAKEVRGNFTAPFAGTHGWYWKNTGTRAVSVTLVASGSFEVVGLR